MDNKAYIDEVGKELDLVKNEKQKDDKRTATLPITHTFEEALALTEMGKFHYQLLLTCGLCFLTVMAQVVCVGVILPNLKCDITGTVKEQGLLASASFFGVVCSSHAMGFLGDTWGRVKTLKLSLIGSIIAGIVSAFSTNVWMLIVTRFLTGIFVSGCQSCVFSLCSEYHSSKTRSRHVTLMSVFLALALILVPAKALVILPLKINFHLFGILMSPWRFLLLSVNISPILGLILLYLTPETPKYVLIHGNHEGALKTLRKVFKTNTGRPEEEYPVKNIQMEMTGANIADIKGFKDAFKMIWDQTIPLFFKERILNTLNICLVTCVSYGISNGFLIWFSTILNDVIHHDGEEVCMVIKEVDILAAKNSNACNGKVDTLTFWLYMFVGSVYVVIYTTYAYTIHIIGKRSILVFSMILTGSCCLAVIWTTSLPIAVLMLTVISCAGSCGNLVGTIAVDYYPTNINSMAMCFIMMIGRLGAAVGSSLYGNILFDHCETTFICFAIILYIVAIMSWFLPEKKKLKSPLTKISKP